MNFFCPVNRQGVPGSTRPSPEQKVYVYVPFSRAVQIRGGLELAENVF